MVCKQRIKIQNDKFNQLEAPEKRTKKSTKKKDGTLINPMLVAFLIFVVVGSAVFQILQTLFF
ncbi:hypothetical protein MXB_4768 [Myxobolus squamalis]|nr:hypothetical protein MXB_4768 [Myxobolus squamalis]